MLVGIKPKISIIVPIYNVENYLHQTLFSVTNQTLKNIEIICIEDCSTDTSAKILHKFAEDDNRIRIIQHTHNQGVSVARREGILLSSGEYIMFLDGDDCLDVNACKELYQLITREKVDILQFGTTIIPRNNVKEDEISYLEKLLAPYDGKLVAQYNGDLNHYCFVEEKYGFTLWNKIYLGDIVREAVKYYPNECFNLAEDLHLFFLIAFFSKTYTSTNKKYYYYNFGAGITGNKKITEDVLNDKIAQGKILNYIKSFVEELDPTEVTIDSLDVLQERFINDVIYALLNNESFINQKKIFSEFLEKFPKEDILSELLEHYYKGNYNIQKKILELFTVAFALNKDKGKIKTIGTFYYRINNGGLERVLSKLISIWLEAGYRVVLFTEEIPSIDDYDYPKEVARVIVPKLKSDYKFEYKNRIHYWQDMILKYEIDTMVYHAWISEYLLLDLLAFKSMQKSFVVHTHSFFAQGMRSALADDAYHSIMLKDIYKICDAIVTLTDVDYSWWSLFHGHVYKTVNPISYDLLNVKVSELNTKNIIWVGRISPEKKPIEALKIMKVIVERGCEAELHFVGKADDENYYQVFLNVIDEWNLKPYVKLHGFHTNVESFYSEASIYLCTSEFEGFSMTLVESKIHGLPAVIYDLPNLDLVRNPQGLIIVNQDDPFAAANAIIELLENESARKLKGKEARKSIENLYSFDILGLWNRIFEEIFSDKINQVVEEEKSLNISMDMFFDFSAKGLEARENERIYWFQNSQNTLVDIESKKRLEEIYNMRTWKLIQKYRNFMDTTKLGRVFSKLRDLIFR